MTKASTVGLAAVMSVFLALIAPALAAGSNGRGSFGGDREFRASGGVLFGGQEVPEGAYRLSWEMNGGGDRVEVRLLKGKRVLATAAGRFVERDPIARYDSLVYVPSESGKLELTEIRFAGSRSAISLMENTIGLVGQR